MTSITPHSPHSTNSHRLRSWLSKLWAPAVLVIASFLVAVPVIQQQGAQFSPIDEWVYYDYLTKVPSQGIVRQGEPVSENSLDAMACVGVKIYGPMGDPCGDKPYDRSVFPFAGITTADAYTPVYFWATYAGAKVIMAAGVQDLLFAARLTSAFWLALAMVLFYGLLRRFGIDKLLIVALGLCLIGSPLGYWTFTFMGTDAPSFAFGCALLLTARLVIERRVRPWLLVVLSIIAVLFKVTNGLAVGLAALYLALHAYFTNRDGTERAVRAHTRSLVLTAVASISAAALTQIGWLILRHQLAAGPIAPQDFPNTYSAEELGNQLVNFVGGTLNSNVQLAASTAVGYPLPAWLGHPLFWISIIGVVGVILAPRMRLTAQRRSLAWSVAIAGLLFAPLLATSLYLTQGFYFPLPSRYGISLVPAFLLGFASITVRPRLTAAVLMLYGLALIAWQIDFGVFHNHPVG